MNGQKVSIVVSRVGTGLGAVRRPTLVLAGVEFTREMIFSTHQACLTKRKTQQLFIFSDTPFSGAAPITETSKSCTGNPAASGLIGFILGTLFGVLAALYRQEVAALVGRDRAKYRRPESSGLSSTKAAEPS